MTSRHMACKLRSVDLFFTLKALGVSGIEAGAATTWDGAVRVWLGEEHAKVSVAEVATLEMAAEWLAERAPCHYPASDYAKVRGFIAHALVASRNPLRRSAD